MITTTIHDLETPSVLIDLDRMRRNISQMQTRCDSAGVKFRPHVKSHKIPDIAAMQIEAGAVGIACQKVSEAEVFAEAGFTNIQIPYNIVGPKKTARLADLALYNRIAVSADHPIVIAGLADAAASAEMSIRVLVELATGLQRTGVAPEEVVALAERIEEADNLTFNGLLVYPGTVDMRPALQEALALLDKDGIGVDRVVGGGTGASLTIDQMPELTELCAGTYIFNDFTCVSHGWAELDDCAMRVMATVVSRPTPDRVILDSGSKTLAADSVDGVHGCLVEYPEAVVYRLNEEHAFVDMSACDERPVIGERVMVIPAHACVVANLHNRLYGIQGESVAVEWPVAARGLVW